MRMKLLKIVVVLLAAGSVDARPQTIEASIPSRTTSNTEQWKPSEPSNIPRNIREDLRYTWNSGTGRIPSSNYYNNKHIPLIKHTTEVSVESKRSRATQPLNSGNFRNSQGFYDNRIIHVSQKNRTIQNSGKFNGRISSNRTNGDSRQTLKTFSVRPTRNGNLKYRNTFYHQSRVPAPKNVIPISSNSNFTTPSTRLIKKSNSEARDRHSNSRIPWNSVKDSHKNSTGVRGPEEVALNNSRSTMTKFFDRNTEFSNKSLVGVDSSSSFDQVAAIKRITATLTGESINKMTPLESKHSSNHISSKLPPNSNRHSNPKHPNRTKLRPSNLQVTQTKKGQGTKVGGNKIFLKNNGTTQNLKNWPNGAIQNSEDFHNYEQYTSIDGLQAEEAVKRPVVLRNSSFSSPDLQEIIHWLKIPAFTANHSHVVDNDQVNGPISVIFDPVYSNLEPNRPAKPSVQNFRPEVYRPGYVDGSRVPPWLGNVQLKNKTTLNPQTQVSQNTVIHLVNSDPKKPNRTMVPVKIIGPLSPGTSSGSVYPQGQSSYPPSILLSQLYPTSSTTSKPGPNVHIGFTSYEEKDKVQQVPQAPVVTYDQSCPTILINSFTRINNTIQSKDGCSDLNIIINSHVFNTNAIKSSTVSPLDDQSYQTYLETDKFGQEVSGPSYQSQWPQGSYYGPHKVPGSGGLQENVEVFQDTQISISNTQNDLSSGDVEPVEFTEDVPGDSPGVFETLPVVEESGASQVNNGPGLNSLLQVPASTNVPNSGAAVSPASGTGLSSGSSTAAPVKDDYDDEYDLSPTGIMESITSVFTYFTFVNPLHYGFFSLAAAPFTALAAGVLGIVTFLFPWVFPSSFNFARASDKVSGSVWQNVEEVVRQSMYKYGRLNEWKSKRKKRKR